MYDFFFHSSEVCFFLKNAAVTDFFLLMYVLLSLDAWSVHKWHRYHPVQNIILQLGW